MAELEEASSDGSRDMTAMLRRVTDLFIGLAPRCNDEQVDLFDDVFAQLTGQIETNALAELGRRLADCENAPPRLIQHLAGDERIAVAGPVLARSVRVTETDLVDIARRASQPHLMAISARHRLNESVTDVLVNRGDNKVLLSVATNAGARFSAPGFAGLVRRAERDEELASTVLERADIPPALFGRLLIQATEVVRQRLTARASPESRELIQQVLAKVAGEIADHVTPPLDLAGALRHVLAHCPGGKPQESDIQAFAMRGEFAELAAALSLTLSVPVDTVSRLMRVDDLGPMIILCKAADFRWSTARAVMVALPDAERIAPQKLVAAQHEFEQLSRESARKVVTAWEQRAWDD